MKEWTDVLWLTLTAMATLFIGWSALYGPLRSLARAWLMIEAVLVVAALVDGSAWTVAFAAVALAGGMPLSCLMVLVGREKAGDDTDDARRSLRVRMRRQSKLGQ